MAAAQETFEAELEVPFPTIRLAEIAYHVLQVDSEPPRSGVTRELSYGEAALKAKFTASKASKLRVALTGFYEKLTLIAEVSGALGPATSPEYSFFSGSDARTHPSPNC